MHDGKPFTDVLGEVENGQLLRDLTREVYKITNATLETRKAGTLKITMKFTPTGRGSVEIDAKYDAAVPEHDRPTTTFFVGTDGELMRNDPSQPDLPLRVVRGQDNDPIRVRE